MVDKWAHYLISKVRYNTAHTHITDVIVHVDNGDTVAAGVSQSRQWIVDRINVGYVFCTIFLVMETGKKGQEVVKDRVNGVDYITTKPNRTAKDNLENLPEY